MPPATRTIRLLAFASAADALGTGETEVELPAGATVADLRALLDRRHPGLGPLWERLAVAVDGELASPATELPDGAEVALLPPVSGGKPATRAAAEAERARLTDAPIDAATTARLLAAVASPRRGATVLFLGTVRDHHRGRAVTRLDYSAYRSMATERLARIVRELEAAEPELALAVVHRLGEVPAGEPSVAIAAASPHRAAAYAASRTALERLKREVPIWKREHYAGGDAAWREEERLVAAEETGEGDGRDGEEGRSRGEEAPPRRERRPPAADDRRPSAGAGGQER